MLELDQGMIVEARIRVGIVVMDGTGQLGTSAASRSRRTAIASAQDANTQASCAHANLPRQARWKSAKQTGREGKAAAKYCRLDSLQMPGN